jgi:phage baseplate assembly protein gpV
MWTHKLSREYVARVRRVEHNTGLVRSHVPQYNTTVVRPARTEAAVFAPAQRVDAPATRATYGREHVAVPTMATRQGVRFGSRGVLTSSIHFDIEHMQCGAYE